jgi:sodium/bile acid cotransporter 7
MTSMVALLAFAWLAPGFSKGIDYHGWPRTGAIVLIFFISGLCLRTEEAWRGLAKWRLHLFVQTFSFVLFPAVAWLVLSTVGGGLPEGLRVGIFILAVLPTTITSCAIYTQLAGGDFAAALFNAVAGNAIGVFLSPLLLILLVGATATSLGGAKILKIFLDLGLTVLAPLLIGQVCHQFAREATVAFRRKGMRLNNYCVLFIVYLAFGSTFYVDPAAPAVERETMSQLLVPLALIVPAHWAALALASLGARLMGWGRADRIAAVFCASQKTLAMGLPLAAAVLRSRPDLLGLACLPIIVYHPTQLLTGALLAQRKG